METRFHSQFSLILLSLSLVKSLYQMYIVEAQVRWVGEENGPVGWGAARE
jgi:hypothetical protein